MGAAEGGQAGVGGGQPWAKCDGSKGMQALDGKKRRRRRPQPAPSVVRLASSEGLSTQQLPAASAGATWQVSAQQRTG